LSATAESNVPAVSRRTLAALVIGIASNPAQEAKLNRKIFMFKLRE
jgi:hypothetical protein